MITIGEKITFIKRIFGEGNLATNKKNFDVWCPVCAHSDRKKKKLSIRVSDTACHCWRCSFSARTLAPLIKKFGTTEQLIEFSEKINPYIKLDVDDVQKQIRLPDDFELLSTTRSNHPDVRAIRNYVFSRGLTDDDLWYYKIGFSKHSDWRRQALMPSFDARGKLNYFVGRSIDATSFRRYHNVDVVRTSVVFNEINVNWKNRLVLCEGPFDYVKCGENAVPILGKTLNEKSLLFCNIVLHNTPVALAFDSGVDCDSMRMKFERYGIDVLNVDVSPYKDPGEMTKLTFREALSHASRISWEQSFQTRLLRASSIRLGELRENYSNY